MASIGSVVSAISGHREGCSVGLYRRAENLFSLPPKSALLSCHLFLARLRRFINVTAVTSEVVIPKPARVVGSFWVLVSVLAALLLLLLWMKLL